MRYDSISQRVNKNLNRPLNTLFFCTDRAVTMRCKKGVIVEDGGTSRSLELVDIEAVPTLVEAGGTSRWI
jgi:hypothetical protein